MLSLYVHSIPPGTMEKFCQSLSLLQLCLWKIAGNRCNAIQQALATQLKPSPAELHFQPFKNLSYFPILNLLPKFPLVASWYITGKLLRCNWISWWQAGDWSFKGAEFHKAPWKDCYTFVLLGTCTCLAVKSPACTVEDLRKKKSLSLQRKY